MARMTATVRDLRRTSRSAVLRSLFLGGPSSRWELSQRTGLSAATVTNVVAELLAEGCLTEVGSVESQGGRPRIILAINPAHGIFIGVDVGETAIRLELFDLTLHQVGATYVREIVGLTRPELVVEHIATEVAAALRLEGIAPERVIGVGVGVPGIADQSASMLVFAPSIGWSGVPLQVMLEQQLPYAICVDNGAKAMALAEALVGAGRGVLHYAAVLVGTGVGAGIIANGALYRGAANGAGEWGHTKITLDGRRCRCGSRGCLEAYVGASALLERWHELDPAGALAATMSEELGIDALLAAVGDGAPGAEQVMREMTQHLALGVANLVNLCNPERISLGGWVGMRVGPMILPELRRMTEQLALQSSFRTATIDLCHLGQDAVALGAASLPFENYLTTGGEMAQLAGRLLVVER